MSSTLKARESSAEMTQEDFQLYWAMVNDQLIERDPEIEKLYRERIASAGE